MGVIVPRAYFDPIFGLILEICSHVVNYHTLRQISSQKRQVLNENMVGPVGMLPVKSIADYSIRVQGVQHPVCIVLHGGCEDNDLVAFGHVFEEFASTWSD